MERSERYPLLQTADYSIHETLHFILDLLALVAAWFTAVECRIWLNFIMPKTIDHSASFGWAPPLPALLVLWAVAGFWLRTYQAAPRLTTYDALKRIAHSIVVVTTVVALVTFFSRPFGVEFSRSFAFLFLPISFVYLVLSLVLTLAITSRIERRWPSQTRVAIVGTPDDARRVLDLIRRANTGSVNVRGLLAPSRATAGESCELSVLGTVSDLAEVINREGLHRVIVANGSLDAGEVEACERIAKRMGVPISCPIRMAGLDETVDVRLQFGMHLLELKPVAFTRGEQRVKRSVDVIGSLALLILLGIPMLIVTALIKLTSRGPVLYRAPRVGRGGRHFQFLKFRSMYYGVGRSELTAANERSGHMFKVRRDPRVTPVGRFLRRYSIDELPQLINVLKGDMSLVGPRPLPAEDLEPDGMSRTFREWAERRAEVRPGITGLWQVSGRSDVDFQQMTQMDLEYIQSWCLWQDLRILAATPLAVLSGRGAY
jgi:exopolysaccharide biosynthesis polyprenyl glycosylphosphotransferase